MKNIYNLLEEPTGEIYKRLILYSLKYCDKFQYVVPHHISQNKSVQEVIKRFEIFLISITEKSEWPGSKLFNGTTTIYQYRLSKESIILLINANNSLYSWVQPNFPEDLCLLRTDDSPWLATITFEKDGYFELTSDEKRELEEVIPELILGNNKVNKVD